MSGAIRLSELGVISTVDIWETEILQACVRCGIYITDTVKERKNSFGEDVCGLPRTQQTMLEGPV